MRRSRRLLNRLMTSVRTDREGGVLVIVAGVMIGVLPIVALAVDLGMAYTARAEAQRVADAAALAGASAFIDNADSFLAVADAKARAVDYAASNTVQGQIAVLDPEDTEHLVVDPLDQSVWVKITRVGLPTWFARLLGHDEITVSAAAKAQALDGNRTTCLKPWAVSDAFLGHDLSVPEQDEAYDPATHFYDPAESICDETATGYGAKTNRLTEAGATCDFGLQVTIKSNNPNDPVVATPGIFMPVELPPTDDQQCATSGGGPYQTNICSCNSTPIAVGDSLRNEPGNMTGPTIKGVEDLIAQDPDMTWDDPAAESSPRAMKLMLIRPDQIAGGGREWWHVQSFGLFFVEDYWEEGQGNDRIAHVRGRFLRYMSGTVASDQGNTSPTIKTLRLVE